MPARARATVSSSSSPPSCMMKATSPAAKSSPMKTLAMRASETSTSAVMSNSVTRPMTASRMMGTPHRMMATHAIENGNGSTPASESTSATPETARNAMLRLAPPHSSSFSRPSIMGSPVLLAGAF